MLKLLSLSDDKWSLEKFDNDAKKVDEFLEKNGLEGLELIRWRQPRADTVPQDKIVGRHMPFWPNWLDFWRKNSGELLRQFGSKQDYCAYYDADSTEKFIRDRRAEMIETAGMGVKYVVFHVTHTQFEHCYTRRFTYSDDEIVDAFIEMTNQILEGVPAEYTVCFENHWFPGLTFLNEELAMRLLEKIHYPQKGFVLDVSHLINTNTIIQNETQAVHYILDVLDRLGEAKDKIVAIHLNNSVGAMAKALMQNAEYNPEEDFESRLIAVMKYVMGMDPHAPFKHPDIRRVIDKVQPQYLVYELSSNSFLELKNAVEAQNRNLL